MRQEIQKKSELGSEVKNRDITAPLVRRALPAALLSLRALRTWARCLSILTSIPNSVTNWGPVLQARTHGQSHTFRVTKYGLDRGHNKAGLQERCGSSMRSLSPTIQTWAHLKIALADPHLTCCLGLLLARSEPRFHREEKIKKKSWFYRINSVT